MTSVRRGFAFLASGSIVGQGLGVVLSPVLAAIYTPDDFGVFAVVSGLTAIVVVIACFRLDWAIPLPKSAAEARQLLSMSLVLALLISGTLVLSYPLTSRLTELLWPEVPGGFWIVAVTGVLVFVTAAVGALSQYATRERAYSLMGSRNALQGIGTVVGQTLLGVLGAPLGLVWGAIVGRLMGVRRFLVELDLRDLSFRRVDFALIREYRQFPLLFTPSAIVNVVGVQIFVLSLPKLYGLDAAGQFAMASRVVLVPVVIVSTACSQLFLGELSRYVADAKGVRMDFFWKWSIILTFGSLLVVAGGFTVAPWLVATFLGDAWVSVQWMCRPLSISAGALLLAAPVSMTWTVGRNGVINVVWDLARLAAMGYVIFLCASSALSLEEAVWLYSAVAAVAFVLMWCGSWVAFRGIARRTGLPGDEI